MSDHAPLFIDVAGTTLDALDRERLAHPLVGGLTLFSRNWESRRQLQQLCAQIKTVRDDLLICVDQEGGRVQRFRSDGFTLLPPMRALGALWAHDDSAGPWRNLAGSGALRAVEAATATGYVLAAELRACGVDLSFAPVLDLDWGGSSVIGDRALHADARVVALLARALIHGLLQAGMQHCAKHYPGHGYVRADSHIALPVDRRGLETVMREDGAPYQWLTTSLRAVMAAHVIYARVDRRPAGYSVRWLQQILRARMGFDGAVFSDDLSMQAARVLDGQPVDSVAAGVAALNAGCDLLLLCNQSLGGGSGLDAWIDGMAAALARGEWQAQEQGGRRRRALLPTGRALDWQALQAHGPYRRALQLLPASGRSDH